MYLNSAITGVAKRSVNHIPITGINLYNTSFLFLFIAIYANNNIVQIHSPIHLVNPTNGILELVILLKLSLILSGIIDTFLIPKSLESILSIVTQYSTPGYQYPNVLVKYDSTATTGCFIHSPNHILKYFILLFSNTSLLYSSSNLIGSTISGVYTFFNLDIGIILFISFSS